MTNSPHAARRMAGGFGETDFASNGKAEPVRFSQAIPLEDYQRLAGMLETPTDKIKASYDRRADRVIHPGVVVPKPKGIWDGALALGVLALGLTARRRQRPSRDRPDRRAPR